MYMGSRTFGLGAVLRYTCEILIYIYIYLARVRVLQKKKKTEKQENERKSDWAFCFNFWNVLEIIIIIMEY